MFAPQKYLLAVLIAVFPLIAITSAQSHQGWLAANWVEAAPRTPAPNLLFTDSDGQAMTLADFRGSAVVVNFWATWCGPCRAEMPTLQALAESDFDGGNVEVLTIALERDFLAAQRFLDGLGAHDVGLVLDTGMTGFRGLPDQGLGLDEVRGLPATLVISKGGALLGHIAGPADWNDAFAHALVRRALD